MNQQRRVIDQERLTFLSFHEIDHEVCQDVRAKPPGNRVLFYFSIDTKMWLVVARSLDAVPVIHLPEAMFIEAESLDRIVPFKPRDIPLPRDRGGVTRLFQLIGKAVEPFWI